MNINIVRTRTIALSILLLCACLVFSAMATSCAPKNQAVETNIEIIEKSLQENFDRIKSEEYKNELSKSIANTESFSAFGVSSAEICDAWLNNFDYKIEDISITDNKASAKVTLYITSLNDATDEWSTLTSQQAALSNEEKPNALSKEELGKKYLDILRESPAKAQAIELNYTQNSSGVWEADEDISAIISKAFLI